MEKFEPPLTSTPTKHIKKPRHLSSDDSICYPPVKKTKDNDEQTSTKETHDLRYVFVLMRKDQLKQSIVHPI